MPYSNELDYDYMGNYIARQSTIPNRMADARYNEELLKWQRQDDLNRGYLSEDDKERFIDAFSTGNYDDVIPEGDLVTRRYYDDTRDFIDRISHYYGIPREDAAKWYVNKMNSENSRMRHSIEPLDPSTQQSFASRLIWGDEDPEYELADERSLGEDVADIGWGFTPLWGLTYGRELEKKWARGYKPGLVEAVMRGIPFMARNVYRAGKSFGRGYQAGKARRMAEQAMRARSLDAPKVRMQNARTGRWDEVNAYPEFVPYEEVR